MSDAKAFKDAVKKFPGLLEALKKPMAEIHYALRELQQVTDEYEGLDNDIISFIVNTEEAVSSYLRANRAWPDAAEELEKLAKSKVANTKAKLDVKEGFGDAGKGEEDFAARVKAIVAKVPPGDEKQGSYGPIKVFLWRVRQDLKMDKPTFQRKMVEANRLGLLSLTRFDLPDAIKDKKLLDKIYEDEISDLNSTFHFVNR